MILQDSSGDTAIPRLINPKNFFLNQINLVLKPYPTRRFQRLNEIYQLIEFIGYFC